MAISNTLSTKTLVIAVLFSLFNFSIVYTGQSAETQIKPNKTNFEDQFLVGEIKISILKPKAFFERYGEVWRLLDGSNISGSELGSMLPGHLQQRNKLTGKIEHFLPDAKGRFLRMHNNGSMTNPENTALGKLQDDSTGPHNHYYTRLGFVDGDGFGGTTKSTRERKEWLVDTKVRAPNGKETHETRPKNLTVNYFIKVDSCVKFKKLPCF